MKNINPFSIFSALAGGLLLAALFTIAAPLSIYLKSTGVAKGTIENLCENTATTTVCSGARREMRIFDVTYNLQGGCYAFKDKSGAGYTFLTVEDGTATFSTLNCE